VDRALGAGLIPTATNRPSTEPRPQSKITAPSSRGYNVMHKILLAADYGVPQLRRRLFIVGTRTDYAFDWPVQTRMARFVVTQSHCGSNGGPPNSHTFNLTYRSRMPSVTSRRSKLARGMKRPSTRDHR